MACFASTKLDFNFNETRANVTRNEFPANFHPSFLPTGLFFSASLTGWVCIC
jgi:hypothetical protein